MKPKPGVELQLKQYGCPYPIQDERCAPWLEGYRKGHTDASLYALAAINGEHSK